MRFDLTRSFRSWWPAEAPFSIAEREARLTALPGYAHSEFAEQFRLLALNIVSLIGDSAERSLAVFSINAGDGRSMIATNLSLALTAHSDVVLVGNGNLSGVHKQFLDPFEVAEGERALIPKKAASGRIHRLWLNPSTKSAVVKREDRNCANEDAKPERKFLIVDAPPAARSAEAFLLAQTCHNVLYVMRKGVIDVEPHQRALEQLSRLNTRVVGIVLNDN